VSVPRRAIAAALRLPPAITRRVGVRRDVPIPTRDGVALLADVYAPGLPGGSPTVLVRTPYGRRGAMGLLGRLVAERGFHVVIQSCRGTFGSGGAFEPLLHEREDGMDTLEWLRRQPWYAGRFGTFGASYLGFVQWAIAADARDELGAMVAVVSASQTRESTYTGGAFALDTVLTWAELLGAQEQPWFSRQVELKRGQPRLRAGLAHLPLAEADRIATGVSVPFFQEWLRHTEPGAAYWRQRGHDERISEVRAPVAMVTGWHDIFLPAQLADYRTLRETGAVPHLTIGPWTHGSVGLFAAALREGLAWLGAHLNGDRRALRHAPVRVHVGGGGGWRDLDAWPPPASVQAWHLRPGGRLAPWPPIATSAPDRFRYDPADPTPSLGGPLLVANRAGQVDNRAVEARPDVLVYTTDPLPSAIEALGPVDAVVYVRGELEHFDVFARLCDVDRRGRSWNVCDGLARVAPGRFTAGADGVVEVWVRLWPTGYRFRSGHRIRVQISGGAHPRFARNPGTGEPLGTAVALRAGYQSVFHDAEHPSAILLPVVSGQPSQ
jgi:putative CocE/NonD family hydrolase